MLIQLVACIDTFGSKEDDEPRVSANPEIVGDAWDPDPDDTDDPEPTIGPWGWDPTARGAFLYEPGVVHDVYLTLPDATIDALRSDPHLPAPAEFAWNDERYDVSVHLKGRYSFRDLSGKAAFKIDFHDYDPAGSFHGVKRLTLNNMVQDGSMLAESASYFLSRSAGMPAPRHGFARVYVNGELYGLYGIVETPDEQFLGEHFVDDDGNLYSGGYGGDVGPGKAAYFELEEASPLVEPYTDLEALCTTMDETQPEAWWDTVGLHFYRDELLGMFAVEIVSGQADGYLVWANNYLLYDDIGVNKWALLPWGTDQAFDRDLGVESGYHGNLADACAKDATCREALAARVLDVVDAWEEADVPGYLAFVAETIVADCEADPRAELPCASKQEDVLEFASTRAAQVRSGL